MKHAEDIKKQRKGIYLLPNLLTTAGLFAGFYSIVAAMHGRYEAAAIAVFIAIVTDGLDGRVARLTNTASDFGAEYDSLSDMVCFGLAPSLVMYEWSLKFMHNLGWAKLGWIAAFFYTATAALRLARFNTQCEDEDKRFFKGLASPAAAALIVGTVWVADDLGLNGSSLVLPTFILTLIAGALMVSNIRYYSFKDIGAKHRVPFIAILAIVVVFMFASIDPPKVILGGFILYALSGPIMGMKVIFRRRQQPVGSEKSQDQDL
ncbi:MAG: CDP-diacylglycerol--serine O-phosphatidyltransferase [Gammaproteobacteria bacterium]|nr:CDP-diacylglycerol--serine O-phosphatidyltransferase [Gammaproteobacteria bacterium]